MIQHFTFQDFDEQLLTNYEIYISVLAWRAFAQQASLFPFDVLDNNYNNCIGIKTKVIITQRAYKGYI